MSLTAYLKKRQFPLHVHISAVFTLLLLLIGIALAVFNYLQTTRIILDSSQKQFNQIAQDVQQDLLNTYQPIRHALNLLALNPNAMSDSFETRMGLLQPFVQALKDNPRLSALFIGDNQGSFFLVRPLRNQAIKTRLNAPQQSAYSVWTLKRFTDSPEVESKKLFFDESLTLLEDATSRIRLTTRGSEAGLFRHEPAPTIRRPILTCFFPHRKRAPRYPNAARQKQ